MNKEETQKKIASVFKKYDYYITDLINSKNPNIIKASGKFGNTYVIREGAFEKDDVELIR